MQRLALLRHSKNVAGWVPWPGGSLRQCLRRFSRFLPQCRDVHVMADLASPGDGWVDSWLKIPANTFIFFHLWWVCSVLCCQTWEGVTSITQAVDSEPANVVFHFVRLSEITPPALATRWNLRKGLLLTQLHKRDQIDWFIYLFSPRGVETFLLAKVQPTCNLLLVYIEERKERKGQQIWWALRQWLLRGLWRIWLVPACSCR